MDAFYRFIYSVFPIAYGNGGMSFALDYNPYCPELVLKMQPGEAMDLGEAHLKKIWDNMERWNAMALDILRRQYEGNVDEELSLTILEIGIDGGFSLGYYVEDDPDNLHWFVDFNRNFVPSEELASETY